MTEIIVEGTNTPLKFRLLEGGEPVDGTDLDVSLVITFSNGVSIGSPAPTVAWFDQTGGIVEVTGADMLPVGSYIVRYKLTDPIGNFGYYPNRDVSDDWDVVPVP